MKRKPEFETIAIRVEKAVAAIIDNAAAGAGVTREQAAAVMLAIAVTPLLRK